MEYPGKKEKKAYPRGVVGRRLSNKAGINKLETKKRIQSIFRKFLKVTRFTKIRSLIFILWVVIS